MASDPEHHPRRILVTGGAGFIGGNFVHHLLETEQVEIANLDLLTYAGHTETLQSIATDPRYHFQCGDIADRTTVQALVRAFRPDAIVNFAAESHVDRSIDAPGTFVRTNIDGTFVLLDCALAYWRELPAAAKARFRFLQVSTDEVYGSLGETGLFTEDTPYSPRSPYSASKAAADHLARAWFHTYGLPVLVTNCSNNYGPYQFPEKLIPLTILNAVAGRALPIYGTGQNVRDWLYVRDHCSALWAVLGRGQPGETYLVGGNNERTNLDVVNTICTTLDELLPASPHRPHQQLKQHVADRPGHDWRYAIDAGRLRRELGWTPAESFATGIRKTIQWYLDNAAWCTAVTGSSGYAGARLGLGSEVPDAPGQKETIR